MLIFATVWILLGVGGLTAACINRKDLRCQVLDDAPGFVLVSAAIGPFMIFAIKTPGSEDKC